MATPDPVATGGARRDNVTDVLHGTAVPDPYRWMEDAAHPDTRAWDRAQNARTRAVLDAVPGRAAMAARLRELFGAGTSSAPVLRSGRGRDRRWRRGETEGRLFSLDRWGDRQQAVLVERTIGGDRPPAVHVILDPHARTGDPTAAIDWFEPSSDGRVVAVGLSTRGDERSTLGVVHTATGNVGPDRIPHTRAASVAWAPESDAFAYTRFPDPEEVGDAAARYGRTVWWHELGTDHRRDRLLWDDLPDRSAWPMVEISEDGRWLLIHVAVGFARLDVHLVDRSTGKAQPVISGTDAISSFTIVDDHLVGHTTLDAPRGRIVAAPLDDPAPERWRTLLTGPGSGSDPTDGLPHVIEGFAVTASSLLVASTVSAVSHLRRLPRARIEDSAASAEVVDIPLPEPGSITALAADPALDAAIFGFTSWARPTELWRWSPGRTDRHRGRDAETRRWSDLPSPVTPDRYRVAVDRYPAHDGTPITLFTLTGREQAVDGPLPTVLTGYGGFGVSMAPTYSPLAIAFADMGGAFAVACIRGGSEEGEAWHRAGMGSNKQQVFDDFAAAADWLVEQGRAGRHQLAIRGSSNGGLLVAATVTQRPDLCRAAVCGVPLTDMVRYPDLGIGRLWIPELGDPAKPEEFAWLWRYSPYHRAVRSTGGGFPAPAVLLLTGAHDGRVDPSHTRKLGAALHHAAAPGSGPIYVRVEGEAGHGMGKPATRQAEEAADVLAFLSLELGATR